MSDITPVHNQEETRAEMKKLFPEKFFLTGHVFGRYQVWIDSFVFSELLTETVLWMVEQALVTRQSALEQTLERIEHDHSLTYPLDTTSNNFFVQELVYLDKAYMLRGFMIKDLGVRFVLERYGDTLTNNALHLGR